MRGIEITFPVDVEVTDGFYQKLDALLGEVCKQYVKTHPGRVMWVFGQGYKMTPLTYSPREATG